nr:Na+/H+ antiporter NhaC [Alkalihalobacillus sp. BA299]
MQVIECSYLKRFLEGITLTKGRKPTIFVALIPIVFMICALAVSIVVYDVDAHIPLLLSAAVACIVALKLGYKWKEIEKSMLDTIRLSMQAILILMIIGTIIGSWIAGGIVPTMIYYGLDILSPGYFLVAACLICCVVAIAAGNAWTAAGTIGVAVLGIGFGLGIPLPMVAGAIISGVYFGDKISPLSETTNLAPGIVGVELFDHIKHMLYTTVPALIISLILYTILGLKFSGQGSSTDDVLLIQQTLKGEFLISPFLLIPPLLIIVMLVYKIPAIPGLTIGSILGALCAIFIQGQSVGDTISALHYGFKTVTNVPIVDDLLNQGGIESMMSTVALILLAMSFGGILEKARILETIVDQLLRFAKSTGSLITATVATCFSANVIACDQYLSIVLPGRMYALEFQKRGLHPKNLSRTVEDAGTMTSPLIPWNTCGAFMYATLGVHAFDYAPYAFLVLLSPLVAILYGYTGIKIEYLPTEKAENEAS